MNGGKRNVIAFVHFVGIRIKRDLLQIFRKGGFAVHAHMLVNRVNKFVDVGAFGDPLVGSVGIHVVHARALHDVSGEFIDAFFLRRNDQIFDVIAEIFKFFFRACRQRQSGAVEHGVVK